MKYDIYINGTIGGWGTSADYVRYRLNDFKNKRCDVAICSLGGYVTDGLEIYQMFKDHGDIHAHFIGMSASAATFLAMGCKEVDMSSDALILIHNASNYVLEWGSFNKEQIDALVGKLGKTRKDLETIDDVIANIYAKRNGKSVDDVKEKMKVAAWINAKDALDFGLVDSVISDAAKGEGAQNAYFNAMQPTNEQLKELGLPPLPSQEENPTADEGILQKVARMLGISTDRSQSINLATQPKNSMLKIFALVAAVLAVDGFNLNEKDNIELTQDQLKTLEDNLKDLNDKLKAKDEEIQNLKKSDTKDQADKIADLEKQLKAAQDSIKQKDEQIDNLKKSAAPEDETETVVVNDAQPLCKFL